MNIGLNASGVIITAILSILLVCGWVTGHNGILTGTVLTIIGGISGAIFGFKIALKTK
jgi:hypothetical protein